MLVKRCLGCGYVSSHQIWRVTSCCYYSEHCFASPADLFSSPLTGHQQACSAVQILGSFLVSWVRNSGYRAQQSMVSQIFQMILIQGKIESHWSRNRRQLIADRDMLCIHPSFFVYIDCVVWSTFMSKVYDLLKSYYYWFHFFKEELKYMGGGMSKGLPREIGEG